MAIVRTNDEVAFAAEGAGSAAKRMANGWIEKQAARTRCRTLMHLAIGFDKMWHDGTDEQTVGSQVPLVRMACLSAGDLSRPAGAINAPKGHAVRC